VSPLPARPRALRRAIGLTRIAGGAALPFALVRGLEARRVFRNRGLTDVSLFAAAKARLAGIHLLPSDLGLDGALVVDVGASDGRFSAALLGIAPGARVIAVEPAPRPRERLRARLGANPNVEILDVAVSAESGAAILHVAAHDDNSSLHRPRPESRRLIGDGFEVVEDVQVRTVTLDELVGERDVDVLKIDVQGAELDVIRGGARTLERARAVLLEMNFFSQYEGDATFNTLHREMEARGFALVDIAVPLKTHDGTAIFADACYARPS
jgi:FkbM family methyltransferase